uniref:hypothetical protein n=1 Tax=Roseivirga sp. TaxID=1964215 RepID=UPI0040481CC1
MLRRIIYISIILAIGVLIGWLANAYVNGADIRKAYTSSTISGIVNDFEIIGSLDEQGLFTDKIKEQYNKKFNSTVFYLIFLKPNYTELTANPTQTLCRLVEYQSKYGIELNSETDKVVSDYLTQIEPVIRKEMASIQSFAGGSGCNIGGTPATSKLCRYDDPARCRKNET